MENQTFNPQNRLLRVSEVAEMLAVSSSFIYSLVQKREIHVVKLGSAIRFRFEDIEAYIDANATITSSKNISYNGS